MTQTDTLLLHATFTWALVGLIWTIQWVQYPGFRWVGVPQWATFHNFHCGRIAWVVAPLMLGELLTGIALLVWAPPGIEPGLLAVGMGLIFAVWLSTAFLSLPLHRQLKQHNARAQRQLVLTNWVRTLTWTIRGCGALFVLRGMLA